MDERLVLESVCDELRTSRELSRFNWERLHSAFGERFEKAWKLVEEKRVKHYIFEPSGREAWIVVGRGGEYQILPVSGYCGCDDFYYRVVDEEAGVCYHFIGQKLAEALGACDQVNEGDEVFDLLMVEWRSPLISEEAGS